MTHQAIPTTKEAFKEISNLEIELNSAISSNQELKQSLSNYKSVLNPINILEFFRKIDKDSLKFLMIGDMKPEDMILKRIFVPPVCIRPSVVSGYRSGTTEDDITMQICDILFLNDIITRNKMNGVNINHLRNIWDVLQIKTAFLFNSQVSGIPMHIQQQKGIRSFFQRLKGKQGRFRGNLSGKRVEYTARSVISPDPNLKIDEVSIPLHAAKILTFPEVVTKHNLNLMRKLVENGTMKHPGANFWTNAKSGIKRYLKYGDKKKLSTMVKVGDLVERHLDSGDIVLFNRQPSLHRLSIQAFKTVVLKPEVQNENSNVADRSHHRTIRFNECLCGPFNADFDGDEMNIHFPQTYEAKAEAQTLMNIKNNLITPKNGELMIAAIQDFITGSYLLTQKSRLFSERETYQIIGQFSIFNRNTSIRICPPCLLNQFICGLANRFSV
ncbi:MAG: DNA-directed RNA polymerase III subunit RPC1 [Paramarteilia canceri]